MDTHWIVEGRIDPRWPINTRGNIGEVFPEVLTPLSYKLAVIPAEQGWRDAFRSMGILAPNDLQRNAPTIIGLGCSGVARGRARVVLDPADPNGLEPGDVLVAPLTDPAWTPLFLPAAAVVVNVGALMSHAIIVSRELGIPCAVSVENATDRIPDGAIVEVDGAAGTVTIVAMSG